MADPWSTDDPLSATLHHLRMAGVFYCRSEFTAPFALDLPAMPGVLMIHVVTGGRCWLEIEGEEPRLLQAGDLALVPHGTGHHVSSDPGIAASKLFDLPREAVGDRYEILRLGGGGAPATVICGAVRFEHPAARNVIALLPKVITVSAWSSPELEWIQGTLRFMAAEARVVKPGGEAVITRLADILVIQAVRSWIAEDPAARTGWLGALQDHQIGRAIALIHRDPGRDWTVASLAAKVAMSRTAFAARFTELVGEAVMQYVTRWRMHIATSLLEEADASIGEVAARVGYRSEAAFRRAFRKYAGVPPGVVRGRSAR